MTRVSALSGAYRTAAGMVALMLAVAGCDGGSGGGSKIICSPTEVVVILDTSSSMSDEAAQLCEDLDELLEVAASLDIDLQILGITEDGTTDADFPCIDDNVMVRFGQTAPGAFDLGTEEDWGSAAAITAAWKIWKEGYVRLIIPISDEGPRNGSDPCNDPGNDRQSIDGAIFNASEHYTIISPIAGTTPETSPEDDEWYSCVVPLMEDVAEATGGEMRFNVPEHRNLADTIIELAEGACQYEHVLIRETTDP